MAGWLWRREPSVKQVPHQKGLHWACSDTQHHTGEDAQHHSQEATVQAEQPCAAHGVTGKEGGHSTVLQRCAVHTRSGTGPHHMPHIQPRLGIRRPASTASQPVASPGVCSFLDSSVYSRHSFCIQGMTSIVAVLSQGASEATGQEPR